MGLLELLQLYETQWPEFTEYGEGRTLANTDITFYQTAQKDVIYALSSSQDSDGYINQIWTGGGIRKVNENASVTIMARASGRCPHGVVPFPMGDPDDIDSWWQVSKELTPEIKITTGAGSTAAQYELLVQQLRSF